MTASLEKLLRECTVLITDGQRKPVGSGFFVAERLVLTAAHVLNQAGDNAQALWKGTVLSSVTTEWMDPPAAGTSGLWPLPDLALLRVQDAAAEGHPCVRFSDQAPSAALLAEGYTRGTTDGYAPDCARLVFETIRPEGEFNVIRCSHSIIDDGLSGGPVLDLGLGDVVGVTKGQRTGYVPLGGVAVAISILRKRHPELWTANAQFHHIDRRWEFARLNSSEVKDPETATHEFLQLIKQGIAKRPAILPPGAHMADIHQLPSVRTVPQSSGAESAGQPEPSFDEVVLNDVRFDGLFQWNPMRTIWHSMVLLGMPGVGKSWLLSSHVDAIATDALDRIKAGQSHPLSVAIPVIVDCAAMANELPTVVTHQSVLDALINAIRNEVEPASVTQSIDAVVRLAYADGRLVSCLDALDEVGMADRQKIRQALPIMAEQGNQLLITSRPSRTLSLDTAGLANCFRAEVVGFSSGQVLSFARAWFSRDERRSEQLEAELVERPELMKLARVPLLSAFLCHLASEGDQVQVLPTTRVEVYKSVILGALSGLWHNPGQQALDPEVPPDPLLRLRVLSDAVAQLSRSWRSQVDRFSQTSLAGAMRNHAEYTNVEVEAQARWYAWHAERQANGQQPAPLPDPLTWEYKFDGLLAHDLSEASGTTVRFAHPILAEHCVASAVATQSVHELREAVDAHRWFDTAWHEIWPLIASLMPEPGNLVELLLDSSVDSWYEQTFLASRCVAAAGSKVPAALRSRVVAAVASASKSWRSFDRQRALVHLGELIHARLNEAVIAAHALLNNTETEISTRLQIAAELAQIGDQMGLKISRTALENHEIPAAYRAWCARAVVVAEDAEGLDLLQKAIKGARKVSELRSLISAIPVEGKVGGDVASQILRDQEVHIQIRAVVGSALIRGGSRERIDLAKELASTPLSAWNLRAALVSELLAAGEDDVLQLGLGLFDDPNLSVDQRVALVESLLRRNEIAVLPRAMDMLTQRGYEWEHRSRLARAVAEIGRTGIEALLGQVNSPLGIDLKVRHIIALVAVGECLDVAAQVVNDPGAPSWIRARVATSLLERGYLSIPDAVLSELATDPEPEHAFQDELIIAMAKRSIPGAAEAARGLLLRAHESDALYTGSKEFIAGLAAAGTDGPTILDQVAQDQCFAEEDRALAIIAMADLRPQNAANLTLSLSEQFSKFTNSRLIILLAEKGVAEVADRLSALLGREPAAYRALFQLLSSSRASDDTVKRFIPIGEKVTRNQSPVQSSPVSIDVEFLREINLTWSSEAEMQHIIRWIKDRIRERASAKLFAFLTPSQLEEFELLEIVDQQQEFISMRLGGYPELVRSQAAVVKDEIRRDPSIVPRPISMAAMRQLSYIAATLNEWVTVTNLNGPQASAQFLATNASVIVSETSYALLVLAAQMTQVWNPYEGHQFLVRSALTHGASEVCQLMEDSDKMHNLLRKYLNEGDGSNLLFAALAGLRMEPQSEVVLFYGALGAAILDDKSLCIAFMSESGRLANERQRRDGLATLKDQAERFAWNSEFVQEVSLALRGKPERADN